MSSLTIERSFSVDAPPDRVWTFLKDTSVVATCLPGATLVSSSEDGRRHEGTVTVKLGTISVSYRGTAELLEVDDGRRRMNVQARAREKVGAGSARMSMTSEVLSEGDGSRVAIEASIEVTGKIVSLGRGMIGIVSEQVVKDFATNLCRKVTAGAPARGDGGETDGAAREAGADPAVARSGGQARPSEPPADVPSGPTRSANALSILVRAVWSRIARLFEPN